MINIPNGSQVVLAVLSDGEDFYIYLLPMDVVDQYPDDEDDLQSGLTEIGVGIEGEDAVDVPSFSSIKAVIKFVTKRQLVIVDEWQGESW